MSKIGRREEILQIASRLFSQKGYHGTTIRNISDECGILAGSLYAHINSKEDLLYEITARGAKTFLNSLRKVTESKLEPKEKMRLALREHIKVVAEDIDAATVFFHEWKALTGERRQEIQQKRDEYEKLWEEILQAGINSGEFPKLDKKFAKLLILSTGNYLYQWYKPNGELSQEEIADQFSQLILTALTSNKVDEIEWKE